MNEILIVVVPIGVFAMIALVLTCKDKYTKWLERKLAQVRQELSQLQQMRTQPWLQGASTEWHLQKKIKELEKRIVEMEMDAGSSIAMIMLKKRDERIAGLEEGFRRYRDLYRKECDACDSLKGKFEAREASARAIMQRFVAFMDEYYSIRGVIEPVKSDTEEDRLLKKTYAEMKQWMEGK